ncbi:MULTISPECIES: GntR family transcriptional regulator [Alteromonas]|jgi:DNA-binding GntR family transcriptional regulator|uniref:GntR family transcriptional regulator n=1 Tax=Alteromonas stellipolaris TaxID=233316 RepID=A0AAW7YW03_9ALTE|nr:MULTISPECIES: GntR family transcriptional regulator [Alteromonas]AMJ89546.1 GntR family transcriptional regulator [Alteromonas sp. Mac2]ALM91931.1 Transcriptional regulator, GntR [Alteromonas stellipolaris LMG 21856]AMJ73244.1 GntR family transcriptional regulator [Alteromonas stellipolaris]AMJ85686.1 GntR family transcriptional regulator [Alteromonas sp. Mac1]AMJ93363.1 GntR family transcriptional regulator [Alteromonas stellipolaris]|mmetsp:Transcript_36889/g.96625  ORF Transcript_36889/g.96625 Transcript_36889/m.96625 type:complete len:201 (-) Transcript_36889:56-658(-)
MKPKILSVRDQIADLIRSDIISGELAPNTKLNEIQLADRFDVSRGPIRDVILKLTKEGLLVSKNNVGASVNTPLPSELQKLSIDLRKKIEEYAAKQLAGNLTPEQLANMDKLIDNMQEHFERDEYTELTKADIAFHEYFVELAGGESLLNLWYPIVIRMRMNYQRIKSSNKLVDEHRDIVNAFREGDAKGAIVAIRKNIK